MLIIIFQRYKDQSRLVIKPLRGRHFPATGLHTRKGCSASRQAGREYGKLSNERHVTRVRKKVEEPRLQSDVGPCYEEDLLCISPERLAGETHCSSGITLFCAPLRDPATCVFEKDRLTYIRLTICRANSKTRAEASTFRGKRDFRVKIR